MANSSKLCKPGKPYPDFPLFPHATRRWAKKIRGKLHYFGPWNDANAALAKYLDQRDDLHAGRTPRINDDQLTVGDLCNRFLTAKDNKLSSGEIVRRTFLDCLTTCKILVDAFGKHRIVDDLASDDFEQLRAALSKTRNATSLGNEVGRLKSVFKYGFEAGLIDRPVRFGPNFVKPAKRIVRQERQQAGSKLFEADQLRQLIEAADQPLKAMILLGINCGFGNQDCGKLCNSNLDLAGGWIDYPRPKTAVDRRCPIWPETVEALDEAISQRRRELDDLVFVTKAGQSWAKEAYTSPIGKEMRKLLDRTKLYRPGLSFYALRHTFETIAGETRDQVAVDSIMGHADQSMAANYRHRISDERLLAVTEHVRDWLFGVK